MSIRRMKWIGQSPVHADISRTLEYNTAYVSHPSLGPTAYSQNRYEAEQWHRI